MAVTISVFMFSKPGIETDKEGEPIEAKHVRALAEELHQRLLRSADLIETLTNNGWEATMTLYDVWLSHPYINTEAEARGKVEDLGLDPEELCFMEFEDEEDFEEDEFDEEDLEEGEFEGGPPV